MPAIDRHASPTPQICPAENGLADQRPMPRHRLTHHTFAAHWKSEHAGFWNPLSEWTTCEQVVRDRLALASARGSEARPPARPTGRPTRQHGRSSDTRRPPRIATRRGHRGPARHPIGAVLSSFGSQRSTTKPARQRYRRPRARHGAFGGCARRGLHLAMGLRSSSPFGRTPPIKPSITEPRAHPLFLHLRRDVVGATHRVRVQVGRARPGSSRRPRAAAVMPPLALRRSRTS